MNWAGRTVLITGSMGFLGFHLSVAMAQSGARVIGLYRDHTPKVARWIESVPRGVLVHGVVEDLSLMGRIINEYEVDLVFHLAAQTQVGIGRNWPLSNFESNIRGTWTVLDAVRQGARPCKVIVASSDKAYGTHECLPYAEGARLDGRFPYDVSKTCTDLIAQSYAETFDMMIAITRCANLFGPGDFNWQRLIPGTIHKLLMGQTPVIRSDGTLLRDYLYVKDAVKAYIDLANWLDESCARGQAFNFGHGRPYSVRDIVEMIVQAMVRPNIEPIILNEAVGEIPHQYLDCTKAASILGWRPDYSIERGLAETVSWYTQMFGSEVVPEFSSR